ncbi:ribosome biogenesis factor YjgA [Thioalkalivibrio thiocyanodenitrificans]|uniref:ribosome biogenesis factor YjgA n=1 Tax=Thioalkalivibrio thiocyanodenitrificans TaxID=243063 RepID=UPI00052564E0|nr:ribosome biogenesis factor YjgA [Thioalkalivibrio thiocyanodenitrificans]
MSEDDDYISRSRLKREAEEAQRLGERLSTLNDAELDALALPDVLATAIRDARAIRQHGALRRQRQYIGKLMRKIDIAPIRAVLAEKERNRHREARAFKGLETWRERLLTQGAEALDAWLAEHPDSDAGKLRGLIDSARDAPTPAARKTASRALFRYLSERARMRAS